MHDELKLRLRAALNGKSEGLPDDDIAAIVDALVAQTSGAADPGQEALREGIQALAGYIETARAEIAELRPERIPEDHIQAATDELDAIVAHTEEATGDILSAAEAVLALADDMDPDTAEKVTDAATKIFEACNFQDITGQRITRIVQALKDIEAKVLVLAATFGDGAAPASAPSQTAGGGADAERSLLNGPQLPGQAQSQEEIDALLSDSD